MLAIARFSGNLMRYYAHFGHKTSFGLEVTAVILSASISSSTTSACRDDFTLSEAAEGRAALTDIQDWRITFVDTGLHSNIDRGCCACASTCEAKSVPRQLCGWPVDLPLDEHIADFRHKNVVASFAASDPGRPITPSSRAATATPPASARSRQRFPDQCGYFVLARSIFDVIQEGEELVEQPFQG